jgi:hypothetical protein
MEATIKQEHHTLTTQVLLVLAAHEKVACQWLQLVSMWQLQQGSTTVAAFDDKQKTLILCLHCMMLHASKT